MQWRSQEADKSEIIQGVDETFSAALEREEIKKEKDTAGILVEKESAKSDQQQLL